MTGFHASTWASLHTRLVTFPSIWKKDPEALRRFVEAVVYVLRTGIAWEDLPAPFGAAQTAYRRFRRWACKGIWDELFLGGIPTICYFASKKFPSDIRKEAAAFVRQMYQTSTLTLQMFIGCGGINVLVEFLEEDIDAERDLVLIGVNGVFGVFELQGPTPKNDFCRIFSRSSVLYPLSLVLNRMVEEDGEVARLIVGRIVQIFLIFSQAESHVKDLVADRMILKRKFHTSVIRS